MLLGAEQLLKSQQMFVFPRLNLTQSVQFPSIKAQKYFSKMGISDLPCQVFMKLHLEVGCFEKNITLRVTQPCSSWLQSSHSVTKTSQSHDVSIS